MPDITLGEHDRKLVRALVNSALVKHEELTKLEGPDRSAKFKTEAERNKALLGGRYWAEIDRDDMLSINHILPAVLTKDAIVAGGQTEFLAKARSAKYDQAARVAEGLLNDVWGACLMDPQADASEHDRRSYPEGGVLEIGWRYKDKRHDVDAGRPEMMELAEENIPDDALPMMLDGQMVAPGPVDMMGAPVDDAPYMPGMEAPPDMGVDEFARTINPEWGEPEIDDPFLERFDPKDFFWDPQCTDPTLKTARFVGRRKQVPLRDIKKNKRYKHTTELEADEWMDYDNSAGDEAPSDALKDDFALVTVYDTYLRADILRNPPADVDIVHVVIARSQEEELLAEQFAYDFGKAENPWCFEVLPANRVDNDKFTGIPDITLARDIQIAHDEAYTQIEFRRAHTPNVLLTPKGTFVGDEGKELKDKIELGEENAVLEVDPVFLPHIKWLDRPEIQIEALQDLAESPKKVREAIGVSEFQTARTPDKEMTARETSAVQSEGGTRQEADIEAYNHFLERVGYKVLCLMQQNGVRPREYAQTGPDGRTQYQQALQEDILPLREPPSAENALGVFEDIGIQYALEISPTKARPRNKYLERQERAELLTALQPYIEMPDPRLPTRPLISFEYLLTGILETYDLPDKDKIIPPEPTPEEIQEFMRIQAEQEAKEQARMAQEKQAQNQREDEAATSKTAMELTKMDQGGMMR